MNAARKSILANATPDQLGRLLAIGADQEASPPSIDNRKSQIDNPPMFCQAGYIVSKLDLINSLRSDLCPFCAGPKTPRQSVCDYCWQLLPAKLQKPLYHCIGEGYEAAMHAAQRHLCPGKNVFHLRVTPWAAL